MRLLDWAVIIEAGSIHKLFNTTLIRTLSRFISILIFDMDFGDFRFGLRQFSIRFYTNFQFNTIESADLALFKLLSDTEGIGLLTLLMGKVNKRSLNIVCKKNYM